MTEILKNLLNAIISLFGGTTNLVLILGGIVLLALISIYVILPALIRTFDRIRRRLPKQLHDELIVLLSHEALVNLYAPADRYVENLEEGKNKPMINAFLSPYSRAVKASAKRKGRTPRNQYFNARRQIRDVSRRITIRRPRPDEMGEYIVNEEPYEIKDKRTGEMTTIDPEPPFIVELKYDGHAPKEITALEPALKAQLAVREFVSIPDNDPTSITYLASKTPFEDRLIQIKPDWNFFIENPATSQYALPMAITTTGEVWSLPTHHTFVFGVTGTGKSGPLLASVVQLSKFVKRKTARVFAIDPKVADLRIFEQSSVVETVAVDTVEAIDLINDFYERMNRRAIEADIDLENGKTGQSFDPTVETPWNYLLIDELFELKARLNRSREGKDAWSRLEGILAMGRSAGFLVIAASQFASEKDLEHLRPNFGNVIVLGQKNEYFNDLFLGKGAAEDGYDSTKIGPSNKKNGYRTAGIGFVKDETGSPQKVRIAYIDKQDLINFILENPRNPKPAETPETPQLVEGFTLPALDEEEIEGGWKFEDLQPLEDEDPQDGTEEE